MAFYRRYMKSPLLLLDGNPILCIGGVETDEVALHVAFDMAKRLLAETVDVKVVNMGEIPPRTARMNRTDDGDDQAKLWWRDLANSAVVLLYNIFDNTSNDRLQQIRDLLVAANNKPRIVVAAGIDPIKLFLEKLRMRPDVVLFVSKKSNRHQVSR